MTNPRAVVENRPLAGRSASRVAESRRAGSASALGRGRFRRARRRVGRDARDGLVAVWRRRAWRCAGAAVAQDAAPTPSISLLRDGKSEMLRGDALAAKKSFRLACFGFLEQPVILAEGLVRLGLAQAALADREAFVATFSRLAEVEERFAAYAPAALSADERRGFEDKAREWIAPEALRSLPSFAPLLARKTAARPREALAARAPARARESDAAAEPGDSAGGSSWPRTTWRMTATAKVALPARRRCRQCRRGRFPRSHGRLPARPGARGPRTLRGGDRRPRRLRDRDLRRGLWPRPSSPAWTGAGKARLGARIRGAVARTAGRRRGRFARRSRKSPRPPPCPPRRRANRNQEEPRPRAGAGRSGAEAAVAAPKLSAPRPTED